MLDIFQTVSSSVSSAICYERYKHNQDWYVPFPSKIFHHIAIFMYINIALWAGRRLFFYQCFVVSMQTSKNFHSLVHESKTKSKYMKNINSKKTYNVFLSALCTFLCSLVLQFATQGKWAGENPHKYPC